jgi:photosystem II stability/assembly factor-like uncharacterized protein
MKGPGPRRRPSAQFKKKFPAGKALGRIQYFQTQRGLTLARVDAGRSPAQSRNARPRRYAAAHKIKQRLTPRFAAAVSLPVWRPLGPNLIPRGQTYGATRPPVSGRAVGIVISTTNPKHLVLCSGGGGLWATKDLGATWQPLTDEQPTLSMGAITAAPGSPNIVYAGTGEGDNESQLGVGLLRSSDGGQNWECVPAAALTGTGVYDIAVDPGDPLHVWVGTMQQLLESVNGGATWRVVQRALTWDISINPENPREIFAATKAGLIRSVNGGASWSRVALPGVASSVEFDRLEVCHAPSRPGIVYAAGAVDGRGALWRRATSDGSFTEETAPPLDEDSDLSQAWYDWCVAVSPADPNVVFWGAVELFRGARTSSGWTWTNVSSRRSGDSIHPDQHHIAFDPSDPDTVYVCNDGGLFRSPNRGRNWTSLNRGLGITEFEFVIHLEGQDDWLIGGTQDNGTLSRETGSRWKQIAQGDGGDCGADEGRNLCYHSYYEMDLERAAATGPAAFRWRDVTPDVADDYECLFYPPMDVRGPVVAKAGVTLFVSDDSALHWTEVPFGNGGDTASAVVIDGPTVIFVGTASGRLYRIRRAAGGWSRATVTRLNTPRTGYISDVVPLSASVFWISYSAFGRGHVFRSADGGARWTNRSGNMPDIPINAIVVDPADHRRLFAASDHGVYETRNAGTRWTDFSNGLPNVVVGDMILHERRRVLIAGTRSRGAWEVNL